MASGSGTKIGGVVVGGGTVAPRLIKGPHNSFLDVPAPWEVREIVMKYIKSWREAFQQQRLASAVEKIAERFALPTTGMSVAEELAKLKDLLDKGLISKEEFEKAKKKLLGE